MGRSIYAEINDNGCHQNQLDANADKFDQIAQNIMLHSTLKRTEYVQNEVTILPVLTYVLHDDFTGWKDYINNG